MMTDAALPDLLDEAADHDGLDAWQTANLREMRRSWVHAAAVPSDLVEAISKASNACETVWRTARPDADFAAVLPTFAEVLTLTQRVGEAKGGGARLRSVRRAARYVRAGRPLRRYRTDLRQLCPVSAGFPRRRADAAGGAPGTGIAGRTVSNRIAATTGAPDGGSGRSGFRRPRGSTRACTPSPEAFPRIAGLRPATTNPTSRLP